MRLPEKFLNIPFAHRGLHNAPMGIAENSRSAVRAAITYGYGVELDVQLSADGEAVVFHDEMLDRLTDGHGLVRDFSALHLSRQRLKYGTGEGIPLLRQILHDIDGRVPILLELKDQSDRMGPGPVQLEKRVSELLDNYSGPAAIMSFNPYVMQWFRQNKPYFLRGLVADDYAHPHNDRLSPQYRTQLAGRVFVPELELDFISYGIDSLPCKALSSCRATGIPVIGWTINSPEQEASLQSSLDNITFEGYLPKFQRTSQ